MSCVGTMRWAISQAGRKATTKTRVTVNNISAVLALAARFSSRSLSAS